MNIDTYRIGGRLLGVGSTPEQVGRTHLFHELKFTFDGTITSWEYFANDSWSFYLTVWREDATSTATTKVYKIIAKTDLIEPNGAGYFVSLLSCNVTNV